MIHNRALFDLYGRYMLWFILIRCIIHYNTMHHMKEEIENRIHPMKKSFIQYLSLRWNLGFIIVLWHQIQNISAVVYVSNRYFLLMVHLLLTNKKSDKISSRNIQYDTFWFLVKSSITFCFFIQAHHIFEKENG